MGELHRIMKLKNGAEEAWVKRWLEIGVIFAALRQRDKAVRDRPGQPDGRDGTGRFGG